MLVSREELRFDFKGAQFDLDRPEERKILGWVFNQFLYGEVTGIQCGYWLYRAPHLNAASFLAKQAGEELSHVKRVLRILSLLSEKPARAHPAVRFLSTGMMGGSWGEHVTLEMALGEGLVLGVFYAMAETIAQPEIRKILESAAVEEERHVVFGETEAKRWIAEHPDDRKLLLTLALLQSWVLRRLRGFVVKRLTRAVGEDHPVLSQFGAFYDHAIRCFELRIQRLGLSERPLSGLSLPVKWALLIALPLRRLRAKLRKRKQGLLTSTYLQDPWLAAEAERFRES